MILNEDPITKKRNIFHTQGDEFVIEKKVDVTDIIEANKAHLAMFDERQRCAKDGEMVASIPLSIYYALPKHIRDDEKEFRKWLDDPDQRAFRTHPTKLSRTSLR